MNPPLRTRRRRRRRCSTALRDGTIDAIATDHAPHHRDEKEVEFECAAHGIVGLETALPLCLRLVREHGVADRRAGARAQHATRRASSACPAAASRAGSVADVTRHRSRRALAASSRTRFTRKSRNTPFGGWTHDGAARATDRRRARRLARRRGAAATQQARGAVDEGDAGARRRHGVRGHVLRRRRRGRRRGGLQHLDDRLPGDPHRSVVLRPAGRDDLSGDRQRRRQPRGRRVVAARSSRASSSRSTGRAPSNWRARQSLGDYLRAHGIPGIQGIDTRALVRHLRDKGDLRRASCRPRISTRDRLVAQGARAAPSMEGQDLVGEVTCAAPYDWNEGRWTLEGGYATPAAAGATRSSSPTTSASSATSCATWSPAAAACASCRPTRRPPRCWR